ncbi:hypothetical protein VTN77DRAFT_3864 [Rasamsonia byssochlamydoides]|uniref:uncharacterized protein n=1 Tax=Rasamsonia byssochlamydoides TaxID=89139 RepID=UPI0037424B53
MDEKRTEKEGTDDAPIRPVSSLLSHFEHLSNSGQSSKGASTPRESTSRFLKPRDQPDASQPAGRASLDLPRPYSPWGATENLQTGTSSGTSNGGPIGAPRNGPSGRRYSRPMSMQIGSSPHLTPVLTVDSPRSPPRGVDVRQGGEQWASLSRGASDVSPKAASWQSSPRREVSPVGKAKSTSVPPPVNRAEKPKIPAKPANISQSEGRALAPTPEPERNPIEDRVSPFSTPPSSPERPPPTPAESTRPRKSPKLPPPVSSRLSPEPLSLPPSVDKSPRLAPSVQRSVDARELGSTRPRPVAEPSRDTKPTIRPAAQPRDARDSALPSQKLATGDHPEDRPSLPPRGGGLRGRPSSTVGASEPRTPEIPSRNSIDLPSRPAKAHPANRVPPIETNTQVAPPPPPRNPPSSVSGKLATDSPQTPRPRPPPISRETKYTNPMSSQQAPSQGPDDSDEEEVPEDTPVPRTDYPDSSQVNRRPPVFKSGTLSIATGYNTREFDVCGKYVCTTGYLTKVWDIATGEQIVGLSHGETVKVLSVAFKPGRGLEDEGTRLWLGTNIGELHEVDINTQSIVASRAYPSRREVIKIHRHKKEMWTLDDEGRLLLWPPDETGTPNLQYSYSHPHDRVARGHTFSMVVGDKLWLATGKEVRIYRPNARDDSFHVLKRPLGANHTGEVTSGTHTTKDGGRVYLGHADGKVTVYSSTDYTCLASVNVSVYKINSLAVVGDYLWAAYMTGMIYVYDTSTNPWTVKKDWHAHESPVCGLVLDPSSLWTVNRLHVTSLGTDNFIRFWDGMLEDDWLEMRMQSKDVEYCNFREIRAAIVTWNAGASVPRDLQNSTFIQDAIHPEDPPEILVFGFQELVDLEDKKITAKSLLMGSKKRDNHEKEHMSRQYRVWRDHLAAVINDVMPIEESYVLLHTANMVGLFTCVFIKEKERQRVRNISSAEVKRGMGGLHGNKGALILRFVLDDSSMCFINCHLAAGQTQTAHRNNDIAAILESESLPAEHSLTARTDLFVGGGDGTMILDHEICILNGDLNYRIDSMPRNVVIEAVRNGNLPKLLERDQLLASKRKNPGFRLRSFNEAPITFAPTYKYDVGSDEYDSSEKKRSPAWCDRVLYRGVGRIKQLEYRRHEVRASDHRPVSASFKMRVKTISPKERAETWEKCQKEFVKERRRLAYDTSIEYLVNILGIDPDEARRIITSGGSR